jgi:Arc/MetJ family transcription regulator
MRTTYTIDEHLVKEAERLTGEKTPSKAINRALDEYIRLKRKERFLAALGSRDLDIDDWYEFRHTERT